MFVRRVLVVVLVLVVGAELPAVARKWTSRSGGFSIEAELVDVRDGNAVLKKTDGSEVSVPLNKLSLGDVRYIKAELEAAEKAIGMPVESSPAAEPATPVAPEPAPEPAPPVRSSRKTLATRAIRYGWKQGETYMYHLKVEVKVGDTTETTHGTVSYTVNSISKDGSVELMCIETSSRTSSPSPRYRRGYFPHTLPPSFSMPTEPDRMTLDRHGRVLRVEGSDDLPYLLGRTIQLPIERLSPLEENRWTVSTDVVVAWHKINWLPHLMLPESRQEQLPATEKCTYTVEGADGRHIRLAKTYELATGVLVDGKPRTSMSGEGQLAFDPQMGVFSSSKMKMRLALREGGVAVEVTALVSYDLASEAEMAKIKADAEKARQAAQELARDLNRPIGPDDVEKILNDIRSGDSTKMSNANIRLTTKRPQVPNRKMAAGLESLLTSDTPQVRRIAANALEHWATPESLPVLVKLLDDEDRSVRSSAVEALGRLKATSAIDRLIQLWPEEFRVTEALKAMGLAAEPAVLKQLNSDNSHVRTQACQVLHQIGTARSIPALEKATHSDGFTKLLAEQALKAIKRRQ